MAAEPGPAVSGKVDLRLWSFQERGAVSLSGQWQFYWNRFVPPSKTGVDSNDYPKALATVPGSWHQYPERLKPGGGDGYATYAVSVLLPGQTPPLALLIRNVLTAYTLYINGEKVQDVGRAGQTAEAMRPEYRHRLAMNMFMVGSIFIMGLYHICLYLLRKTHIPPAWLGLFCLLISLRVLVTNELFLHSLFPWFSWEVLVKLEYLSYYLAVPVFVMFVGTLFPEELGRRAIRRFQVIGGIFSLTVLFFPARIFSHTIVAYEAFTLAGLLFMTRVLIRALRRKRDGIGAIMFGFVFLILSIINDMLHANSIIQTAYSFQWGMFVFIFCQAVVLSRRFANAFETIETQAGNLKVMNAELTREIQTRKTLETSLVKSHEDFKNSRIALILGLAKLAEYRDTDTGTHLERIRIISLRLQAQSL